MLYSACYRIKAFRSLFFLFLLDIMQVTFSLLMVKWSHTYDAPLPIYPVAFTNGSSISVFLRDHNNQSILFLDMLTL